MSWHGNAVAANSIGRADSRSVGARATSPVRVCIVAPSVDILGGQAIQAERLLGRFGGLDFLETGFIPINPRLPSPIRFLQRIKYVRTIVTSILYVALLVSRLRHYDVVHVFSASYWSFLLAPLPAMLIARLYAKKVVLNYRSGEARDHLERWGWITIPAMRLAHTIVVPSHYLVDVFSDFGIEAQAVHNFVEVHHLPYRPRQRLTANFLSNRNFEPHYNVACVLQAFARIQSKHPEARLTLVGDGNQRRDLGECARSLRLRHVEFVGAVPPEKMGSFLNAADIYLNAPDIDNMPISILEAFASGVPVVSTDAGGIPYVVRHGKNGLLVPCGDHEALAREALRLLDEPELVAKITSSARSDCLAHYTWTAVQSRWARCYTELLHPDSVLGDVR